MPTKNLMSHFLSALMLGSCLTPAARSHDGESSTRLVERYPVCGYSFEPRFVTINDSILSQAMLGVNPHEFNKLDQPTSGLMDQIFIPVTTASDCANALELNNFIGKAVQDVHCSPLSSLSMRTLHNYNSFRDATSISVTFKSGDDVIVGNRASCATSSGDFISHSNDDERKLVNFFKSGGEIVLGEARCQTHAISVNLNTSPTFTTNFHRALKKLSFAATGPASQKSRETFFDFIDDFGTHLQDTTFFGSRLLIMKLFAKVAANSSEITERHRCVSSSFTQNLRLNTSFDDVAHHFSRDATLNCADSKQAQETLNSLGLSQTRILAVGTVPLHGQHQTFERPVPIEYRLQKISRMFQEEWFDRLGCSVDGAVIREFFDHMTKEYQNNLLEVSCASNRKVGCGYNSKCDFGEKCVEDNTRSEGFFCRKPCETTNTCPENTVCRDDNSIDGFNCRKGCNFTANCPPEKICVDDSSERGFTCQESCGIPGICSSYEACYSEQHSLPGYICVPTKPGRALIVGGKGSNYEPLQSVEQVNFMSIPDLPVPLSSLAAAASEKHVILCGGIEVNKEVQNCYSINIESSGNQWEAIPSSPLAMSGHSAVPIGKSLIWFFYRRYLVKFDNRNQRFSTARLPFDAIGHHCSVSNGTHVYVVGVGDRRDEIWVNEKSMDESEWRHVSSMVRDRIHHACLWYGSNIMITGGYDDRSDVEIFNTETQEVWAGENLLTGREDHKMMLLDGLPTVLGGENHKQCLNSFESFSIETSQWEMLARTLKNPRQLFTLIEI